MNNNEYLDNLMKELAAEGVEPPKENKSTNTEDFDLSTIMKIQQDTNVQFSDEQLSILRHHGSACILACAGSGKTTLCINLIAKRIMTGEIRDVNKLIYTTFSKAGATEMKERLDRLMNTLGLGHIKVQVRTIHSFFLQVLRTFGVTAGIISASDRTRMVRQACKDAEFTIKNDDLMIIDNLLSYQVNNLLSDKKTIESYVNTLEELELDTYKKIRQSYTNQKNEKGVIDYDDMQSFLYLWLVKWSKSENPAEVEIATNVRNYCKAMWTNFYIDEAQDVSKLQFAILRAMVADPNNTKILDRELVFIGDDDQCIYEWRGSDPSIILTISATFDMPTFVLSTNYRCKNEVVDYAAAGIKYNNSRYSKGMNANEKGGDVKIAVSVKNDLCSLSNIAVNHIKWLLKNNNKLSDIAVLCRNNNHLSILNNMLLREGIYCNATEDMKFTNSYVYSDLKDIIDLTAPNWKYSTTAKMLWRMCRFMGQANATKISKFQDTCNISFDQMIGWLVKKFIDKTVEYENRVHVSLQAEQEMEYIIARFGKETRDDLETLYRALSSSDREEAIETLFFLYRSASAFMYKSKDKSRSLDGMISYLRQLLKKDGVDKTLEFLRVTEQLENGKMVIPGEKITLSTIHSAKGREWKNVIMFACDNVSSPSFDGIVSMLNDDVPVADIVANIDEERRLFYVGNTRAKENLLTITYMEPSIFILESLGIVQNSGKNNYEIVEMAQDNEWAVKYKDKISDMLLNSDSKYFYNFENYNIDKE